jgi:hypothetical protein
MRVSLHKSKTRVKCRECGRSVKEAMDVSFDNYAPTNRVWGGSWYNLYLCKECLEKLRCEIDALTILVKSGIDTK